MRRCAIAGLLIAALSSSAWAQAKQLPDGRFTLFAGNSSAANFFQESSATRVGERVTLTMFRVYATDFPTSNGPISQDVTRVAIDCSDRTFELLSIDAFQGSGQWVNSLPSEPPAKIEPLQIWDFLARIFCDGVQMAPSATVEGVAAARRLGLSRLQGNPDVSRR